MRAKLITGVKKVLFKTYLPKPTISFLDKENEAQRGIPRDTKEAKTCQKLESTPSEILLPFISRANQELRTEEVAGISHAPLPGKRAHGSKLEKAHLHPLSHFTIQHPTPW